MRNIVFPQNGGGGLRNGQSRAYTTTPSNKPQEPHRDTQIGVGVYLYYPALKSLPNKQDVKYPDITVSADINNKMKRDVASTITSTYNVKEDEASSWLWGNIGFFDVDAVHPALTSLECDSTIKYPRRIQ